MGVSARAATQWCSDTAAAASTDFVIVCMVASPWSESSQAIYPGAGSTSIL